MSKHDWDLHIYHFSWYFVSVLLKIGESWGLDTAYLVIILFGKKYTSTLFLFIVPQQYVLQMKYAAMF